MEKALKTGMSILLVALMLIPLAQQYLKPLEVKPLSGDIVNVPRPDFTWNAWMKGEYQQQRDIYWKAKFGFQPFFIRLNNQIHYTLYGEIKAKNVIEGQDGYLYEGNYIEAYFGTDYVGEKILAETTAELKELRTFLNTNGSELLIIVAPGKGSFYPEHFPKNWQSIEKSQTNYAAYKRELESAEIPLLDFKAWFEQLRHEVKHPLFPKAGIHWSKYGEYRAADSLLRFIKSNNLANVGSINFKGIQYADENRDGDYDIAEGMNLLCPLATFPMAYPNYSFVGDENNDRVLVIADSYYWGLFNKDLSRKCFGNGQFWFYNEGIFPESFTKDTRTRDLDYKKALLENKLVIIICTDANLSRFPFGVTKCLE